MNEKRFNMAHMSMSSAFFAGVIMSFAAMEFGLWAILGFAIYWPFKLWASRKIAED